MGLRQTAWTVWMLDGNSLDQRSLGMPSQIFRLFISSTFADFRHEREALHERVFPALEAHCQARGAQFEVVDLRWGISPEAQDDLRTLKICLEEVERCRRIGLSPHFVALVGDRYGWEPAPVEIDRANWQRMSRGSRADLNLLEAFYRIDRNAAPPVYALRKDAYAKATLPERAALLAALRRLAHAGGMSAQDHPAIFAAATHQEILSGLLSAAAAGSGIAFLRSISGLPLDSAAGPYIDLVGDQMDGAAHARVQDLKTQIRSQLPVDDVREVSAVWAGSDISTTHIDGFCTQFLADHIDRIDRSLVAAAKESEAQAHDEFARQRARLFVGRRAAIDKILRFARTGQKPTATPLMIEGGGGTGKSALLAHAAQRMRAGDGRGLVFTRFIGAVAGAEDLGAVLNELARAIATAQGRQLPQSEASFDAAAAAFQAALASAREDRPISVFIDALDQLPLGDQLQLLDWLPDSLPPFARVILSTRPGPIVTEARRRYPRTVMRLVPMPSNDSTAMLDRLLADAGRTLTRAQRAKIRAASPGLPLWTRLAFEEARLWKSDEPGRRLERTVEGLIRTRIAELSSAVNHGAELVRDALGAIAASRFGLSDSEMAQALSQTRAPEVWAAFRARSFHVWNQPVLPAILWFRLRADLAPYLVEQRVDGALTYRFFHREFSEVVSATVLANGAKAAMHGRLADVFSEPSGPAFYRACDAAKIQDSRALRRVMEHPWQLAAAGLNEGLERVLSDVTFVAGKCAANRISDLMQDIATLEARLQGARDEGAATWRARLRSWRAMLEHADERWPAHRVLFQLLLEANPESLPRRAQAVATLKQAPPDWPVLLSVTAQDYVSALAQDLPARAKAVGVAPLTAGFLAEWDDKGGLRILDRRSAALVERIALGSPKAARAHLAKLAPAYGATQKIFDIGDANDANAPVSVDIADLGLKLSWRWGGCLAVKRGADHFEIVLGKDDIMFVGQTEDEVFFRCDDRWLIVSKSGLVAAAPGLYTYSGSRVQGLAIAGDDGGWTHERFNSVVFLDPDTCMTLGFSGRGGQRDDVILEMYKTGASGISRVGYGVTDHDLDLPIWHICGLSDGAIVLASERYWHTFIWTPPFDGDSTVEMLAGAAVGNGADGNWVDYGDKDGALTFVPTSPSVHVAFDAPGVYGLYGGDHFLCDGVTHIDADDHSASANFTGFETTDSVGALIRWHCDVRAHWIFARTGGDFVVFKNSGPVRVERWQG
jgi:hypothetical protein